MTKRTTNTGGTASVKSARGNSRAKLPPLNPTNELIGDRLFKFKAVLINNDGRMTKLRRGAIESLIIEDNILDWFHKGYLIFKNPQDFLERAVKSYKNEDVYIDMEPYTFRSDGRDYIYIELDIPISSDDPSQTLSLNTKTYTIKLLCSIYATEDITSSGGSSKKTKKLYFWDYRYELMSEKNSFWSTSAALRRIEDSAISRLPVSQQSNADRSILTGLAIKDVIRESFPKYPPKFSTDWDDGGGKVFHCAPAGDKMIDTLEYLLDSHISTDGSNNQPCILSLDRFTDEWSLLPIGEYYKRAYNKSLAQPGPYQQERFYLGQEASSNTIIKNEPKIPRVSTSPVINFHNPDVGIISDYEFTEMAGFDNATELNSTMAHKYDSGQFDINLTDGDIENVRDFFERNITDYMLGDPKTGPVASFIVNKLRKENKNIYNVYTGSDTTEKSASINAAGKANGRNKTLQTILFKGNAIMFNVKGMPNRRSGRFIGIDRNTGYDESNFDSKLLGQYFVTSVLHSINTNGYHNQIIGLKPYYFKDLKFNESII